MGELSGRHPHWGGVIRFAARAVLVALGCSRPAADAGPLQHRDLAAIAEVRTTYVKFELSGDRRAQAELYAPDAVLLEPNAPVVQGRRAIRAGLEEYGVVLPHFTLKSVEVGGAGSLAYDRGVYTLEFLDAANGTMATERGNYLMILRRERDGSWHIAALIHNPQKGAETAGPISR